MTQHETAGAREETARIAGLERIDWRAAWLAPYAERGVQWQRSAQADPAGFVRMLTRQACLAAHVTGYGRPLSFIEQAELPAGTAYETHIAETGGVPTRRNLHDFFNALVWFAHPRVKTVLNAHQARAIERDGVKGARGVERDFLTLFDENAVLFVCADPALSTALTAFDWGRLFVGERVAWGERCEVRVFGHALLEKLIAPYKACTGHAWIVAAPPEYFRWPRPRQDAWLDREVAASLEQGGLEARRYAPLPVLGVPGFWPDNADPLFYADAAVFRSGRRVRGSGGRAAKGAVVHCAAAK
jgi:hypothetical protein